MTTLSDQLAALSEAHCPFCGEEKRLMLWGEPLIGGYHRWVHCECCFAQGPTARIRRNEDPKDVDVRAVKRWGDRVGRPSLSEGSITREQADAEKREAVLAVLRNPTDEDCANAALSFDHSLGVKSEDEQKRAMNIARFWLTAWENTIRARIEQEINDDQE